MSSDLNNITSTLDATDLQLLAALQMVGFNLRHEFRHSRGAARTL